MIILKRIDKTLIFPLGKKLNGSNILKKNIAAI